MGTRHLIEVKLDEKTYVAQYGQWDGYPSGQGATILKFLRGSDMEIFKDNLRKTRFLSDKEIQNRWEECGADPNDSMVGMEIADKFNRKYPHLSRNCGAEVLGLIYNGKATELYNSSGFEKDTTFCEWYYTIDLDKNVLKVWDKEYPLDKLPTKDKFIKELEDDN